MIAHARTLLVVCALSGTTAAAEDAHAVRFDAPDGWKRVERGGAVVFSAPGLPSSEAALLAVLPPGSPSDWPASFVRGWEGIKREHRDAEEVPGTGGTRNGHAFQIMAGSMAEASGRFLYLSWFTARNEHVAQPILFVATSAKLYEEHAGALERALSSVRLMKGAKPSTARRPDVAALLGSSVEPAPVAKGSATDLVGTWSSGSVSPVGFYNAATGEWAAPSGTGQSYALNADGTFEYAGLIQTSLYGCTTRVFIHHTGTWKNADGRLVLRQKARRTRSTDNCNAKFNYEKQPPPKTETYPWRIARDADGSTSLVLTTEDGELSFFRQ